MNPNGLIARLRQRRVFRTAGYYILGAWVLLQVGDVVVEPAGLPPWSMTALLYLCLLGFPVALFLGWRYDLTDHGLVRTLAGNDPSVDSELMRLKPVDYAIIAGLLVVIGAAAWNLAPMAREAAGPDSGVADEALENARDAQPGAAPGSVAVLPFANLSALPEQRYLAHGISDTVLHVLAQVEGLDVTARTSSFAFEDSQLSIPEIAAELRVLHVLEGSVQQAGEQVRIIARLINAQSGTEVWSGYYDRAMASVFDIQDEIAQEVATALTVTVLQADDVQLAPGYQPDLAAFEQVVLGREALARQTRAGAAEAYERFGRAAEIDPDYALAHAELARAAWANGGNLGLKGAEIIELAERHVARALDLDPLLPEGHLNQARIYRARKQFPEAEQSARRALELRPSEARAYTSLFSIYESQQRFDEALGFARKAVELDPESNNHRLSLARALWNVGRSEAAVATLREAIRRSPETRSNYYYLARWLMQMGRTGEAMAWQDVGEELDPDSGPGESYAYCHGLLQLWAIEEATGCFELYLENHPDDAEAINMKAHLTRDVELGLANGREQVELNPDSWYRKMQLADWLADAGLAEELIELLRDSFPGLFLPEPEVQPVTIWVAKNLVRAYQQLGQNDRAEALIEAALSFVETQRKLQGTGLFSGPDDVTFLALRGDLDEAIARLTEAIDRDWQFYSFSLIVNPDPHYPPALQAEPGFQAQVERQRKIMAQEYRWYLDNRGSVGLLASRRDAP